MTSWRERYTEDELHCMAVHEAGHAVVAMYLGKDILITRINVMPGEEESMPDGGGYSQNFAPRHKRSWHACSALAGVFACAVLCRDRSCLEEFVDWKICHEDMRLFNRDRDGMTFRQGRAITLDIVHEMKDKILELAEILKRDGYADYSNASEFRI